MSNDIEFIDGLIVKAPREQAPEYIKAALSIKRAELIKWLSSRDDEWINVDIKEAKSGKWYAAVDSWKPSGGGKQDAPKRDAPRRQDVAANNAYDDSDIPF